MRQRFPLVQPVTGAICRYKRILSQQVVGFYFVAETLSILIPYPLFSSVLKILAELDIPSQLPEEQDLKVPTPSLSLFLSSFSLRLRFFSSPLLASASSPP